MSCVPRGEIYKDCVGCTWVMFFTMALIDSEIEQMFKTLFCIYHHFSFLGMRLKDSIRSTWHLLILQRTYIWNENKKDSTNHVTRRDQSSLRWHCVMSQTVENHRTPKMEAFSDFLNLSEIASVWNSLFLKQTLSETTSVMLSFITLHWTQYIMKIDYWI